MTYTNTTKKAAGASNTNGPHPHTNVLDFRTAGAARQAPDGDVIARLALAGHIVHKGTGGDFLVCKYGLSRWCKDFAELKAFASRAGVHHGTN